MKIASVCTILPTARQPAAGIFVQRRLEALSRLACVRVLKPTPWFPGYRPYREDRGDAESLPVERRPMFYVPGFLKGLDSYWLERSIFPVLRAWRDRGEIEVVDAHFGYPEGVGCVRAARRLGLPAFVTLRGSEMEYLRHPWIGRQIVHALRHATGIVAVSESLRTAALERGIAAEKLRVVANAVDDTIFFPGSQSEARAKLGLPVDRPLIVAVGQLIERKGHHTLVRAVFALRQQFPNVQIVIVGGPTHEPAYPRRLRGLIESLGLQDHVRLLGALPPADVADWLRAADGFALATTREGCCNAVLEAMACGLPIVTTPAGDNETYVEPPKHGFIVPADQPTELANALAALLRRDWDRDTIVSRVVAGGWDAVAQAVLEFMEERLNSPGAEDSADRLRKRSHHRKRLLTPVRAEFGRT